MPEIFADILTKAVEQVPWMAAFLIYHVYTIRALNAKITHLTDCCTAIAKHLGCEISDLPHLVSKPKTDRF